MNQDILCNLQSVKNRIRSAEQEFSRPANSVMLLPVSKKHSIQKILALINANISHFGENLLQEALPKIQALQQYNLHWHFLGSIQSNKTQDIAENFAWVHSIDRIKIAERLNQQRPLHLPPLNVCIQINISNEPQKSGIHLSQLPEIACAIGELTRLKLRGLMCIPKLAATFAAQQTPYIKINHALKYLNDLGFKCDTLSMGMSKDLEAAISQGSTLVRIGQAIFGPRPIT